MIHFLVSLLTNDVAIKEQERCFLHVLKVQLKVLLFVQKFFQSLGCSEGLRVVVLNSASLTYLETPCMAKALSKNKKLLCVASLGGGILIIV